MDLKKLRKKYERMDRLQLQQLQESYNPDDYNEDERKIIEEIFVKFDVSSKSKQKIINSQRRSFIGKATGLLGILLVWAIINLIKRLGKKVEEHDREMKRKTRLPGYPYKRVEEKESPEVLLECLPKQIATFVAKEEIQVYEQKELGASLTYHSPYMTASIYIFDLGQPIIPDGIDSDSLKQAYMQAQSDILQAESMGLYENVSKQTDESTDILFNKNQTVSLLRAYFTCDIKDEGLKYNIRLDLYMTGIRNHIVKIRVTYPNLHAKDAKPQIDKLLESIFGILVSVDN